MKRFTLAFMWLGAGLAVVGSGLKPAQAGPVVCTTSLEAPIAATRYPSGAIELPATPVEVTRCGVVQTPPELIERRYFSWTSPFARGVNLTHQITDALGIAMGGGDGTKVMGFGFPDQAIVWDGSAVENTAQVLLDLQSSPELMRTADLPSSFGGSVAKPVAGAICPVAENPACLRSSTYYPQATYTPVRGLW
jgi:hypothetical protein